MELLESEITTRQIAEEYVRIEENTEYLTNIHRYSSYKKRAMNVFTQSSHEVEVQSFFKIIVQTTYLLYTCYIKKISIYLSKEIYCSTRRDQTQDIYIEYLTELDFNSIEKPFERQVTQKCFKKYSLGKDSSVAEAYGQYVLTLIDFFLNKLQSYVEHKKDIKQGLNRKGQLSGNEVQRQIKDLQLVLRHLESHNKKIASPKVVILSLEETEVFMQYSILLKVMNNSIFSKIKQTSDELRIQKESSIDLFQRLLEIQKNELSSNKGFEGTQFCIESAIQKCFKELVKEGIVSSQKSLNETKSSNSNHPVLGQIQGKEENRKFFCSIKKFQKPFEQFSIEKLQKICISQKQSLPGYIKAENVKSGSTNPQRESGKSAKGEQGQPGAMTGQGMSVKTASTQSEYLIEYLSNKNLLCIKYITSIQLNIENTDSIMYQCNNVSFDWSSVSIDLVDKNQSKTGKKKERYVAFKTLVQFNFKETKNISIFLKILLLIDLLMVCAKISEPELRKTLIKLEDWWRVEEINSKIHHVVNLFIKKVDKIYKNMIPRE